jgi:hypothetical protein
MKVTFSLPLRSTQNEAKRILVGIVIAAAVMFPYRDAKALPIDYGAASSFSVLAGTLISNGGPDGGVATSIGQDVGLSPAAGTAITGLSAGQVGGTIYTVAPGGPAGSVPNAGLLTTAKNAFGAAYTAAAGEPVTATLGLQLGGQHLMPGVYTFVDGTVLLSGTTPILTLDANGEADPVWIFLAKSDLTTAANSSVVFVNGGTPCDVLWRVPTQATLGASSDFVGTIMAGTAIVMGTDVTLHGRAWAEAEVTLLDDTITGLPCTSIGGNGGTTAVPDGSSTLLLLGFVLATLSAYRRRFFSVA